MSEFAYKAFITYSHQDAKAAAWIQKAVESYRVPSKLRGGEGESSNIPRRLRPIFRDRNELPAGGNLTAKISESLAQSEFLIVVCSPAAYRSHWVNLEIAQFRKTHDDGNILCLIVDGEPFAERKYDDDTSECFPPALSYGPDTEGSRKSQVAEPIAADIRPGCDGKRLARSKIVAGLLDVGLDSLVQRDNQRRYWRMAGLSAVSITGMVVMAILTLVAVDARQGEELRRAEAEDLIEFMLSDLRQRLEAVGRLDVLDAVGEEAIDYYSRVELEEHTADSLGRRARAFHLLGEVDELRGDMDMARTAFEEAYASTGELLSRAPNDGERVYDHAQSVFWLGFLDWQLANLEQAEAAFREYLSLAGRLAELDDSNMDWLVEGGYANVNLGTYLLETGSAADSIQYFDKGLTVLQEAVAADPENLDWQVSLAQIFAWSADANRDIGELTIATNQRAAEAEIYVGILAGDPSNQDIRQTLIVSHKARAELFMYRGDVAGAVTHYTTAKSYGDALLHLEPDNTFTASVTVSVYTELAEARAYQGAMNHADQLLAQASEMAAQLVARDPQVVDWQLRALQIPLWQGTIAAQPDNHEMVIESLVRVVDALRQLLDANPEAARVRSHLAEALFVTSNAWGAIGDNDQRGRLLSLAIHELESMDSELTAPQKALLSRAYEAAGNDAEAERLSIELKTTNFGHPRFTRPIL